jgi:pyruvate dehydrogenase E1 component alpha subunit/2-oxoisovalerate dehydrogenase E1 component alpha subunit
MEANINSIKEVDTAVWSSLLRTLFRCRKTEERLIRLYHQAKIYGGVYTGVGQESMGAAAAQVGGPHDLYAPLIRDLSVHYGRGETPRNIFRQWLARSDGPTRGRDGNVHFGNLQHGVYAMISHLGAMLSVVVGGVMARRMQGQASVGFGFIGDGGTSTGDFHEAINFAAVREVPVVFVIENNKYAYSTPNRDQYRCARLVDKAVGYGVEGHSVDGNDAVSLYLFFRDLTADLRSRPRAVLVECDTLRMRGHGEHDSSSYVPKDLLAAYAARDPLKVARERLITAGALTADDVDVVERAVAAEVDEAYQRALQDAAPDPRTLEEGVYADG